MHKKLVLTGWSWIGLDVSRYTNVRCMWCSRLQLISGKAADCDDEDGGRVPPSPPYHWAYLCIREP